MKKDFNLTKLFYSFAIAFSVVTLSSCNNDDNSPLPPPSTNDVAGTYNGKVLITQVTPATVKENAGEAPQGQDVNAMVKNDTEKDSIYLAFDPKPLTLQLPAAVEGQEGQTVTVTISSPDKGSFAYKKNQLKLKLSADKVELAGVAVPVPQTLFDFDMTKKK